MAGPIASAEIGRNSVCTAPGSRLGGGRTDVWGIEGRFPAGPVES
jgi:hypothetical protein